MLTVILLVLCAIVAAATFGFIAYVAGRARGFNDCYRQFFQTKTDKSTTEE